MKKVYKILIGCAAGLLAFGAGVVTGGSIGENKNYSGTVVANPSEGPGPYDWKSYAVAIPCNAPINGVEYYTNNGDCIYNVNFFYKEARDSSNGKISIDLDIKYEQSFPFWDDLDTFMVLTNGVDRYTTEIETSHTCLWEDVIHLDSSSSLINKLKTYYICEIWVRTVD